MKKFKAGLSITRIQSNRDASVIRLQVIDYDNHQQVLRLGIPLDKFTEALTGLSDTPCDGTLWEDAPVGKVAEQKWEEVRFRSELDAKDPEEARTILKPYEKDGWVGEAGHLTDHRYMKSNMDDPVRVQRVHFTRYVDAVLSSENPD